MINSFSRNMQRRQKPACDSVVLRAETIVDAIASRWFLAICVFLLGNAFVVCGPSDPPERSYSVRLLDPALIGDADAVVREHWESFDVRGGQDARRRVLFAVTVFNEDARKLSRLYISYGHYVKIKHLDARLFDAEGKEIRSLGNDDTHDYSTVPGYILADDSRVRSAELYTDRYPYTVEFSYETRSDGPIWWPGWIAQEEEYPVEHSYFEITVPEGQELRYWANREAIPPRVTTDDGRRTYAWEASHLQELSADERDEDVECRTSVIETAPSFFQLDNFPCDMTSWKSFGAWYKQLAGGRDKLPASAAADVHRLIDPQDSPRARAEKLYRYMQSRTRYVAIELGIAGWQPLDATFVHDHGYGDCKALSNYMVALLKEAGIPAYPVLIYAGGMDGLYQTDFPSQQFNHEIVCVPLGKDSLWLECTSEYSPPGHLGQWTENRFGLLIGSEGGSIAWTPMSRPEENGQRRVAVCRLARSGMLTANVDTKFTGDQQDRPRYALSEKSEDDRKKWLVNTLGVTNATLQGYAVNGLTGEDRTIDITEDITVPLYGSLTGTRIMFLPNLMERRTSIPRERTDRRSPVRYNYPFRDRDSIVYLLPKGFAVEALPSPLELNRTFGSFHSSTRLVGDSILVYNRELEISSTEIPPTSYADYRNFAKDIVKADKAQVVLVKKEGE